MIWVILIFALIVRLISLDQSLWLDEAISVLAARDYSFFYLISEFSKGDFHPFLHYVTLGLWGSVWGFSEISMRLVSVVFGLVTIYFTYLIAKKIQNHRVGIFAALFLSVNPLHIYYSQEARMYSMAAMGVAINFYYFLDFLKTHKQRWNLGFILSFLLVFFTDYVASLIVVSQLVILVFKDRNAITFWLKNLLVIGIIAIFWLPILSDQFMGGMRTSNELLRWKEVLGGVGFKEVSLLGVKSLTGRIGFWDNPAYIVSVAAIGALSLIGVIMGIKKANVFGGTFLASWFFAPVFASLGISIFVPVFSYFRFVFIIPALSILLSIGFLSFGKNLKLLFICGFILLECIFSGIYLFNPNFHREDWRGVVNFLEEDARQESLVIFESNGNLPPFTYYGEGLNFKPGLNKIPANDLQDVNEFSEKKIYLLEYLVDITDPSRLLEKKLKELRYQEKAAKDFRGVGIVRIYEPE